MRPSRARMVSIGLLTAVFVAGCIQGQDYRRPTVDAPAGWEQMGLKDAASTEQVSTQTLPNAEWWRAFENDELSRLVEQALEHNHDVRRAAYRVMEGQAIMVGAGAGLYPQVNLQGGYTNLMISRNTLAGLGLATGVRPGPQVFAAPGTSFDLWNAAADLRWELDLWGRIRRGLEAATAEAGALEQDRRAVALTLISEVGQSYFRLRELDEQTAISEHNLAIRQESLDIIRTRASVGLASELDVQRAEVLVKESGSQIPEWIRLRTVELHRLEVLTGSSPGTLDLPPKLLRAVVVQPEIPVGLPSQLLERRPDILQAEHGLIAANARIGEARAYFFPSLSITGQGGLQSVEFTNWFTAGSRFYSIGPSLTLPIFLGRTNVARLDAAASQYEQMLEGYRQTILVAFREVADLLVSIRQRTEQLAHQREQTLAAKRAVELAQIRYRKGLVNYLDVLDAERTMLSSETQLVSTERARLIDMVNLYKALGGGWELTPADRPTSDS